MWYIKFVLSSKDWRKATGKDGKLIKHESSVAQTATDVSFRDERSVMICGVPAVPSVWREAQARGRTEDEKQTSSVNNC